MGKSLAEGVPESYLVYCNLLIRKGLKAMGRLRVSMLEMANVKFNRQLVDRRLLDMGVTDPSTRLRLIDDMQAAHERRMFARAIGLILPEEDTPNGGQ